MACEALCVAKLTEWAWATDLMSMCVAVHVGSLGWAWLTYYMHVTVCVEWAWLTELVYPEFV